MRVMPVGNPHKTDENGHLRYPHYGPTLNGSVYPMQSYNGCETWKSNRRPSQSDVDNSPYPIRRFTNVSATDVQLHNGMRWGTLTGRRIGYLGTGYLWTVAPIIPGQTRDNVAGFHKRGPSPYNVADIYAAGPGQQPEHPGGPGQVAGPVINNPMSG